MEKYAGYNVPEWKEYPMCDNRTIKPCKTECVDCIFETDTISELKAKAYHDYVEFHDLTKIRVPFGLLSEETQERLKSAWNGKEDDRSNIQYLIDTEWINRGIGFTDGFLIRIDPNYKVPQVKEVTMKEVCEKFGCEIKIKKEC